MPLFLISAAAHAGACARRIGHSSLCSMFPQVSPHLLLHSARAAVGGLRRCSRAAPKRLPQQVKNHTRRIPTHPLPASLMIPARLLWSARVGRHQQLLRHARRSCIFRRHGARSSNNDLARGRRRGSAAVRPQPHERPETGARHRACLHAAQHAAHLMRTCVGTMEYHTHGRCRASSNVRGC